jgi:predicted 3-demethylubiquinone-9 3-methyltransferase (glyoxalase superfamily)
MTVEFELNGQRFVGINGGPNFTFDEAISFEIDCETQEELDYCWEGLDVAALQAAADGPA